MNEAREAAGSAWRDGLARWRGSRAPAATAAVRVSDTERLAAVAAAARSGLTAEQAWAEWDGGRTAVDDGVPRLDRDDALAADARVAARLARSAGVPLSELVGALARLEAAREQARLSREVALAGPRASSRLLTWLPALGLALGVIVEPATARVLFATPLGWALALVAALLVGVGRAWMRALVRAAVDHGAVP